MKELIEKWRSRAAVPPPDSPMGQVSFGYVQSTLENCADELEEAWHDHAHDGDWESDGSCQICLQEIIDLGPVKPVGYSDELPG